MKYKLFLIALNIFIVTISANCQVNNDDCSHALDYGLLDGRKQTPCLVNGAYYDTCFHISNMGAKPDFPFYYTNNYCGPNPVVDSVKGVQNDVWYKVELAGLVEMFCFPSSPMPSSLNSTKLTLWSGDCGTFSGTLLDSINFYKGYDNKFYGKGLGSNLFLQLSGWNSNDTIDFNICLTGIGFIPDPFCTVNNSSFDSLCFLTSYTIKNPSLSLSDGNISVHVVKGTPPYSYNWNGGETDSVLNNLSNGNYFLTITDAKGCKETKKITLKSPTSLEEILVSNIGIKPNPSTDGVFIIENLNGNPIKDISVFDLLGNVVLHIEPPLLAMQSVSIDLSSYSNETYIVRVKTEQEQIVKKIIKTGN